MIILTIASGTGSPIKLYFFIYAEFIRFVCEGVYIIYVYHRIRKTMQQTEVYCQTKNACSSVIFNIFQCLQNDCNYWQLCATYSCRQSEQVTLL